MSNPASITRISGLDVAGPCFEGSRLDIRIKNKKWGLTSASGNFVDNIHTDFKLYGTHQSKGHLDFFAGN